MDALSTTHPPLSSLRPKQFLSANPNSPLHLLKPAPQPHASLPPFANLSAKPNSASLAPKPARPARSTLRSPSQRPAAAESTAQTRCKAATGYAAALLDVAACDGQLAAAAKDARRFARLVRAVLEDEEVGEAAKGEVLAKVLEGGGFYAKLAVLVRMLVRKGKVRMVGEVMEEFGSLWGQLCGKQRPLMA